MMESYSTAGGSDYEQGHVFANQFFGQVKRSDALPIFAPGTRSVTGLDYIYRFGRNNLDVTVIKTLDTPIPLQSLLRLQMAPPGNVTSVTNPRSIGQ